MSYSASKFILKETDVDTLGILKDSSQLLDEMIKKKAVRLSSRKRYVVPVKWCLDFLSLQRLEKNLEVNIENPEEILALKKLLEATFQVNSLESVVLLIRELSKEILERNYTFYFTHGNDKKAALKLEGGTVSLRGAASKEIHSVLEALINVFGLIGLDIPLMDGSTYLLLRGVPTKMKVYSDEDLEMSIKYFKELKSLSQGEMEESWTPKNPLKIAELRELEELLIPLPPSDLLSLIPLLPLLKRVSVDGDKNIIRTQFPSLEIL